MPPADLMPEVIRQLAIQLNITNAGILFDENFVMNHKYKSLLLNVPTRHIINQLQGTSDGIKRQLSQLRDLDVVNYFLLGDQRSINMLLKAGDSLDFIGRKYGWFIVSLNDAFWPSCSCENITILLLKPQPPANQSQPSSIMMATLPKPFISSAFYYDLTLLGVSSMKSALDNGDWPIEPAHIDCDSYNGTNVPTRGFDFLAKLKATSKEMTPTYAGFHWGKNNGRHHAEFKVNMFMVNIEHSKISTRINNGYWQASIETPMQVSTRTDSAGDLSAPHLCDDWTIS